MRKCRLAVAIAAAAVVSVGCSTPVAGTARPETVAAPADVRPMLLDPAQFPNAYPAVVLPQPVAQQAAGDMSGLSVGAESISPADCTPDSPTKTPDGLAVAVGTNDADRSTLTLVVENVDSAALGRLREDTTRCADISAKNRATDITVHTELLDVPADATDAALVWRRTVRSGTERSAQHQTMVTMVGQEGAVRVFVTYMTFGTSDPDLAVMGKLLAEQISKIRQS